MCLRFIFFILVTKFIPQCPSKRAERWKQQATIFHNIYRSNIIHNVRKLLRQETQDSAFSEETPRSKVRGNLSRHEHLCLCYCCFGPCLLPLFETVYVIVVLGPVSYCWFWYCCFGPCLFLLFEVVFAIVALLLWGEAKVQGTLYLVKEIYVRIFCAGKRRGTARCQSPRSTSRSTAGSNCQNRIPPIPLHSTYPCLYLWQRQCVDKCIYTIVQHICQGGGLLEFSGTVKTWPWHWVDGRAPLIKQATPNYFLQENSWTGRPSQ